MSVSWSKIFADRTSRMKASDIRELLKLTARPEIISLASVYLAAAAEGRPGLSGT